MGTSMTIEYDCGKTYVIPLTLNADQSLLANASLGDTLIAMADYTHDQECTICKSEEVVPS